MNSIRPVRKGAPFTREVVGGVFRTPAPSDGLVVDLVDKDIFLEVGVVVLALQELGYSCVILPKKARA